MHGPEADSKATEATADDMAKLTAGDLEKLRALAAAAGLDDDMPIDRLMQRYWDHKLDARIIHGGCFSALTEDNYSYYAGLSPSAQAFFMQSFHTHLRHHAWERDGSSFEILPGREARLADGAEADALPENLQRLQAELQGYIDHGGRMSGVDKVVISLRALDEASQKALYRPGPDGSFNPVLQTLVNCIDVMNRRLPEDFPVQVDLPMPPSGEVEMRREYDRFFAEMTALAERDMPTDWDIEILKREKEAYEEAVRAHEAGEEPFDEWARERIEVAIAERQRRVDAKPLTLAVDFSGVAGGGGGFDLLAEDPEVELQTLENLVARNRRRRHVVELDEAMPEEGADIATVHGVSRGMRPAKLGAMMKLSVERQREQETAVATAVEVDRGVGVETTVERETMTEIEVWADDERVVFDRAAAILETEDIQDEAHKFLGQRRLGADPEPEPDLDDGPEVTRLAEVRGIGARSGGLGAGLAMAGLTIESNADERLTAELWDHVIGQNPDGIRQVTPAAWKILKKHAHDLSAGLDLEHLPAGFRVGRYRGQLLLDYNPTWQPELSEDDALRPRLTSLHGRSEWLGNSEQCDAADVDRFAHLFNLGGGGLSAGRRATAAADPREQFCQFHDSLMRKESPDNPTAETIFARYAGKPNYLAVYQSEEMQTLRRLFWDHRAELHETGYYDLADMMSSAWQLERFMERETLSDWRRGLNALKGILFVPGMLTATIIAKSENASERRAYQALAKVLNREVVSSLERLIDLAEEVQAAAADTSTRKDDLTTDFTEGNWRAMMELVYQQGPDGVDLTMQHLSSFRLASPEDYKNFKQVFMDNADSFAFLSGPAVVDLQNQLSRMTVAQKDLWWAMAKQHVKAIEGTAHSQTGSSDNFFDTATVLADCSQAFDHFLARLGPLAYYLPETGVIDGDMPDAPGDTLAADDWMPAGRPPRNMQVVLNRILYIVDHVPAAYKIEQVKALSGLDFGIDGARYAIEHQGYQFVHPAMQLTVAKGREAEAKVDFRMDFTRLGEMCGDPEVGLDQCCVAFHRFIGCQASMIAMPYQRYCEITEYLQGLPDADAADVKACLPMLASVLMSRQGAEALADLDSDGLQALLDQIVPSLRDGALADYLGRHIQETGAVPVITELPAVLTLAKEPRAFTALANVFSEVPELFYPISQLWLGQQDTVNAADLANNIDLITGIIGTEHLTEVAIILASASASDASLVRALSSLTRADVADKILPILASIDLTQGERPSAPLLATAINEARRAGPETCVSVLQAHLTDDIVIEIDEDLAAAVTPEAEAIQEQCTHLLSKWPTLQMPTLPEFIQQSTYSMPEVLQLLQAMGRMTGPTPTPLLFQVFDGAALPVETVIKVMEMPVMTPVEKQSLLRLIQNLEALESDHEDKGFLISNLPTFIASFATTASRHTAVQVCDVFAQRLVETVDHENFILQLYNDIVRYQILSKELTADQQATLALSAPQLFTDDGRKILRGAQQEARGRSDAKKKAIYQLLCVMNLSPPTPLRSSAVERAFQVLGQLESTQLAQIFTHFQQPPLPTLERMATVMKGVGPADSIASKLIELEQNPVCARDLEAHFPGDDDIEQRVMAIRVMGPSGERALPVAHQRALIQGMAYINQVGGQPQPGSLKLNLCMPGYSGPPEIDAQRACDLTSADLKQLVQHYRAVISGVTPVTTAQQQVAQWELMALMREAMYRATGKFPYSTQMLNMMDAMMVGGNHMSQINTGEGKSLTAAMMAACQWAKGNPVDLCSANDMLAQRDFEEQKAFFDVLGVGCHYIDADSEPDAYDADGVHYASVAGMALFTESVEMSGGRLPENSALILDEADALIHDKTTTFRLARPQSEGMQLDWVYEAVYRFVRDTDLIHDREHVAAEDVAHLRDYVMKAFRRDPARREAFERISDSRLDGWIDAACDVIRMHEGEEFVLDANVDEHRALVKPPKERPDPDSTYGAGRQQLLHARLNVEVKEGKRRGGPFYYAAETTDLASRTGKSFLERYSRGSGGIRAITGTAGDALDLAYTEGVLTFRHHKMAPHTQSQRLDQGREAVRIITLEVARDGVDEYARQRPHFTAVYEQAKASAAKGQPVLILWETAEKAELFERFLKETGHKPYQVFTGNDSSVDPDVVTRKAGRDGMMTVSTAIMGRGTDISPQHADGLCVVDTFIDVERESLQKWGRAGRGGKKGESHWVPSSDVFARFDLEAKPDQVAEVQRRLTLEKREARSMELAFGDVREDAQQRFAGLMQQVHDHLDHSLEGGVVRRQWHDALDEVNVVWDRFLRDMGENWDRRKLAIQQQQAEGDADFDLNAMLKQEAEAVGRQAEKAWNTTAVVAIFARLNAAFPDLDPPLQAQHFDTNAVPERRVAAVAEVAPVVLRSAAGLSGVAAYCAVASELGVAVDQKVQDVGLAATCQSIVAALNLKGKKALRAAGVEGSGAINVGRLSRYLFTEMQKTHRACGCTMRFGGLSQQLHDAVMLLGNVEQKKAYYRACVWASNEFRTGTGSNPVFARLLQRQVQRMWAADPDFQRDDMLAPRALNLTDLKAEILRQLSRYNRWSRVGVKMSSARKDQREELKTWVKGLKEPLTVTMLSELQQRIGNALGVVLTEDQAVGRRNSHTGGEFQQRMQKILALAEMAREGLEQEVSADAVDNTGIRTEISGNVRRIEMVLEGQEGAEAERLRSFCQSIQAMGALDSDHGAYQAAQQLLVLADGYRAALSKKTRTRSSQAKIAGIQVQLQAFAGRLSGDLDLDCHEAKVARAACSAVIQHTELVEIPLDIRQALDHSRIPAAEQEGLGPALAQLQRSLQHCFAYGDQTLEVRLEFDQAAGAEGQREVRAYFIDEKQQLQACRASIAKGNYQVTMPLADAVVAPEKVQAKCRQAILNMRPAAILQVASRNEQVWNQIFETAPADFYEDLASKMVDKAGSTKQGRLDRVMVSLLQRPEVRVACYQHLKRQAQRSGSAIQNPFPPTTRMHRECAQLLDNPPASPRRAAVEGASSAATTTVASGDGAAVAAGGRESVRSADARPATGPVAAAVDAASSSPGSAGIPPVVAAAILRLRAENPYANSCAASAMACQGAMLREQSDMAMPPMGMAV